MGHLCRPCCFFKTCVCHLVVLRLHFIHPCVKYVIKSKL
jgi:hypothetical protein